MKTRKIYIVGKLVQSIEVDKKLGGYLRTTTPQSLSIPLSVTDGMVGAFPAFYDKDKAETYSGGRYPIAEEEVITPEVQ